MVLLTGSDPPAEEPVVLPADVATWLRQEVVDAGAALCIAAAMLACRAVVSPIPASAGPIVIAVAARAYANPVSATSEASGPFSRSFGISGVFITDGERAMLVAAAGATTGGGRGGAFTIDPTPVDAGVPWQPWPADWDSDGGYGG